MGAFDPARRYRLHPKVAVRPEPFGALAYHYGNRRLLFLRSPRLVQLVRDLEAFPTAADALDALGVSARQRELYERSLTRLEASEVICAS